jgi:hypothetical protein
MHKNFKLLALLFSLPLVSGFTQADWLKFKSTEENFTISLPSEPSQEQTRGKSPLGNGHHIYRVESNGISYTISNSVLENPPAHPEDIKRTFDFARDLVLMVTNGKLLSNKDISLDRFPGREVRIEKGKMIWTLRAYVVRERLYQLMTTEPKSKEQSPETIKFFESFKLLILPE